MSSQNPFAEFDESTSLSESSSKKIWIKAIAWFFLAGVILIGGIIFWKLVAPDSGVGKEEFELESLTQEQIDSLPEEVKQGLDNLLPPPEVTETKEEDEDTEQEEPQSAKLTSIVDLLNNKYGSDVPVSDFKLKSHDASIGAYTIEYNPEQSYGGSWEEFGKEYTVYIRENYDNFYQALVQESQFWGDFFTSDEEDSIILFQWGTPDHLVGVGPHTWESLQVMYPLPLELHVLGTERDKYYTGNTWKEFLKGAGRQSFATTWTITVYEHTTTESLLSKNTEGLTPRYFEVSQGGILKEKDGIR